MYVKELGCQIKTSDLQFKDVDNKKQIVVGYFSAFGSKDSDGDIILPGAYAKSIKERGPKSSKPRIKHLLDHDKRRSVAVIQELEEDEIGLKYTSKAGSHDAGQDWFKMCESGIISEHSVGFETIKEDKKSDANYMSELLLWEGSSLQSWGANENTPIVGIKEMKMQELQDRFATIEKALTNGTFTDKAFIQLEKELKAIKHLLSILTTDTTEPDLTTTDTTLPGLKEDEVITTITINQIFKQWQTKQNKYSMNSVRT
jgi:HK97 family phage prohead protease